MAHPAIPGFRLGIYVFKDAEIIDFAAPYGVFSVARRFDAELDAFLIADAMRPVQAQAGFTVLPNYTFDDRPAMHAFLIPGGFGSSGSAPGCRHLQDRTRAVMTLAFDAQTEHRRRMATRREGSSPRRASSSITERKAGLSSAPGIASKPRRA